MKFFKILLKNYNYFIYLIFSLILVLQLYISYNGLIEAFYFDIYDFNLDRTLFKNDLYLQNTLLIDHSILLKVFKLFKINLHNDLIGIPLYFLINLIGIYFFYKLMIEIFEKDKNNLILILILIITLFYNNLTLVGAKSIFLTNHTGTFTSILMPLIPIFVYFYFKKKFVVVGVFSLILILLSPRIFWMPILIVYFAFFLDLQNKTIKEKNIFYTIIIFISFLLIYLFFSQTNLLLEKKEKLTLLGYVFNYAGGEDSLLEHPTVSIIKLLISFFVYTFFLRETQFKSLTIKNIFVASLIMYLLAFIFYFFYNSFIYRFFPSIEIVGLNPIRAVYIYNFFFIILSFIFITTKIKNPFIQLSSLFFILLLNRFEVNNIYLYYLFIIFLTYNFIILNFKYFKKYFYFFFILFILVLQVSWFFKNLNNPKMYKFDLSLFNEHSKIISLQEISNRKFGKFYKEDFEGIKEIKKCDDFILLFLDSSNDYNINNFYANWYLKKSRFVNEPGHLFMVKDFKIFEEHIKRKNYLIEIIGRDPHQDERTKIYNSAILNEELIKKIVADYNLVVIVLNPKNYEQKYLIYHNEVNQNCLNKLKNNNIKFIK